MSALIDKMELLLKKNTKIKLGVLFFFAILLFSWQEYTTRRVAADEMIQIGTTQNFLSGNGFNIFYADNLNEVQGKKISTWPYFYRIAVIPFLVITNKNVELSFLFMEIMSFIVLLLTLRYFANSMNFLKKEVVLAAIYFFSSFAIVVIKQLGGSSDLIALSFSLLSLMFFRKHFIQPSDTKNIILFFISIALLPQIRYAYIPVSIAFLCFYCITVLYNMKKFKAWHLSLIILPIISLLHTIQKTYFINTAERLITTSSIVQSASEHKIIWLKPFYAPFFNSFFPDYILISAGLKSPVIWEKIAIFVMTVFALISFIIILCILYYFIKNTFKFRALFFPTKLHETGLIILIFSSLALYIVIYKNHTYTHSEILSETFLYEKLANVNRLFAPIQMGTYLLVAIYAFKYKSKFFKLLIITSLLFGCMHFLYLRTVYHPFNRKKNMMIVNNPAGSYNDAVSIGNIIKKEKISRRVFYLSNIHSVKGNINNPKGVKNYMQINPNIFAMANAAIILSHKATLSDINAETESVYYSGFMNEELPMNGKWKTVYAGEVYGLWIYEKD